MGVGLVSQDLLMPIFREGKGVYDLPSLVKIRDRTAKELGAFDVGVKRFINPHQYVVGMEKSLYDLKVNLITNIRTQKAHAYISPEEKE